MNKLRLGVIGTGSVVREIYQYLYFYSNYSNLISIEAVAESQEDRLNKFCNENSMPYEKRYTDYKEMINSCVLDAVHVNTPDSLHEEPTITALENGLDVLLPKPLSDNILSAHRMRTAAKSNNRLIGVDFHKRGDPRVIEGRHRYRSNHYGEFQYADWHMMDRLLVADPNHDPPFFATPDFAEKNSPISFLTVHMADSFMHIVGLRPIAVRANAWSQKLPSLKPKSVHGYDMCDTEVVFENNGIAHFVTGWHWPNTTPTLSREFTRTICTDGIFEIMHTSGVWEITHNGIEDPNILFQTTDPDGTVIGFGMSVPGNLLCKFAQRRDGLLSESEIESFYDPITLGFWSSVIVEAANLSLRNGERTENGVTFGEEIKVSSLLDEQLGSEASKYT